MNKLEQDTDAALRSALARLPRSIEPERDLWAGIKNEISAGQSPQAQPQARAVVGIGWAIAASVVSVAIGILITLATQHRSLPVQVAAIPAAGYSFVPASTDAVRVKLNAAAVAQLANLSPQTRDHVEKDLDAIKKALADIQGALAKDPGNALLQDLLVTTYQNELDTLANVQALAGSAHSEVST